MAFDWTGAETARMAVLVNPGVTIPEEVTRIHGITDAMVCDALRLPKALRILELLAGRDSLTVLAAHNAAFDVDFVRSNIYRDTFDSEYPYFPPVLDTNEMAERHRIGEWNPATGRWKTNLTAALKSIGVTLEGAHRALADVLGCKELLVAILKQYDGGTDLSEIPGTRLRTFDDPARRSFETRGRR